MYSSLVLAAATLCPLVSAHFKLNYPPRRGYPAFDEDALPNYPCANQPQTQNRTMFPMHGGPIQLDMGHTQTNIEVFLAIGNDVGDNFDTVIVPDFSETGLGNFCISGVNFVIPSSLNVTDGTNATIQVVTNGDDGAGGLYQCADIMFTSNNISMSTYDSNCMNNTGVKADVPDRSDMNEPNGTSTSDENSTTSTSPSASATTGGASLVTGSSMLVLGVLAAIAGFAV